MDLSFFKGYLGEALAPMIQALRFAYQEYKLIRRESDLKDKRASCVRSRFGEECDRLFKDSAKLKVERQPMRFLIQLPELNAKLKVMKNQHGPRKAVKIDPPALTEPILGKADRPGTMLLPFEGEWEEAARREPFWGILVWTLDEDLDEITSIDLLLYHIGELIGTECVFDFETVGHGTLPLRTPPTPPTGGGSKDPEQEKARVLRKQIKPRRKPADKDQGIDEDRNKASG